MPVEFTVDAHPDAAFQGTVDRIYPEPEIRDNIVYYQAIVDLDADQAGRLKPEMTTQCRVIVQEKSGVVALPNRALKWVGDEQVVFKVDDDGRVTRVKPELGLQGLASSEVVSGLARGDKVATDVTLTGRGQGGDDPR
jgi:HlyD family secretion protein/macrolide-specific efflux system membrane fusion protein